jgi:hypothetical protein
MTGSNNIYIVLPLIMVPLALFMALIPMWTSGSQARADRRQARQLTAARGAADLSPVNHGPVILSPADLSPADPRPADERAS